MVDECPPFVIPAELVEYNIDPFVGETVECPPFVFPPDPLAPQKDKEKPIYYYLRTTANVHSRRIGVGGGSLPFRENSRIVRKIAEQGGGWVFRGIRRTVTTSPGLWNITTAPPGIDPKLRMSIPAAVGSIETIVPTLRGTLDIQPEPAVLSLSSSISLRAETLLKPTSADTFVVAAMPRLVIA